LSSATDVNVKGDKAPKGQAPDGQVATKKRRSNPVVLEVPVSVTGARPATTQDKRDLFTEETHTVLVFKDGAVIQLSAAITVGQLLFLTEKKTKREVVCQVVHKRNHRPTSCYVELEFTEDAEDIWGVSFPGKEEEAAAIPAAAEAVEAEETTEDDPGEPVEAPKSEDVAQLKGEVEALRAQLRELQDKKAAEEREAQARKLDEAEAAARAAAETEARQRAEEEARKKAARGEAERAQAEKVEAEKAQAEKARAEAEAETAQKAAEESRRQSAEAEVKKFEEIPAEEKAAAPPALAAAPPQQEPPPPSPPEQREPHRIGMKLPTAGLPQVWTGSLPGELPEEKAGIDPLEELLPKPALDFSKAKGLDPNDPYNIYKPLRRKAGWQEIVGAAVVVALLVTGGGFAWYENWLPFLHRAPKTSVAANAPAVTNPAKPNAGASAAAGASVVNAPATGAAAGPAGPAGATAEAGAPGNVAANSAASTPATGESQPDAAAGKSEPAVEKNADAGKAAKSSAADKKVSGKNAAPAKAAAAKSSKNHGKAETSAESKPQAVEEVASDAPVLPAKLVRSVQPVYPPDAMRGYITGDVRIEADVDAAGHVGAMKVLVGPAPLRQAAMDALKQYEYAPATQGGKAVASKVTVTIKFWFDP